jgi:hypothetical protein
MMDANNEVTREEPLDALVEQLLLTTDALGAIADHMTAFAASGFSSPDAPPVEVVLAELLKGVLAPLVERHGRPQVEAAAAVLEQVGELACSELYLVAPEELGSDEIDSNGKGPPPAAA